MYCLISIDPLGMFGAKHNLLEVDKRAREDAALAHPHAVYLQANALYTMAIAHCGRTARS